MVIQKVINNNVISAYDVNQQEIVIMGKGIGFKAHTGELIDESKIEKVFRIENENLSRQFQELLENIPLEHMQLTSDIISYAIKNLNVQLNQNIYITLTETFVKMGIDELSVSPAMVLPVRNKIINA